MECRALYETCNFLSMSLLGEADESRSSGYRQRDMRCNGKWCR